MDLSTIGLFNLASRRMDYLSARHKVLAENIANADTPGARARDLKPFTFAEALKGAGAGPVRTDAAHLEPLRPAAAFRDDRRAAVYETAPDGNSVILEEQMTKTAEVRQQYDLAANLFQKGVGMMRFAYTGR
ncbi:flagellar basal body protein [Niveispirillum fermenti]|uniref:flagellar basal body protein n=1 Tax=Niveispirillum fermenti TaxID=1233113 RepID=UPI003A8441AD